jgi:hypothetical protein
MRSSRRIVSDMRYTISSVALIAGMACLASLHQSAYQPPTAPAVIQVDVAPPADQCQCTEPTVGTEPVVIETQQAKTPASEDACTCGTADAPAQQDIAPPPPAIDPTTSAADTTKRTPQCDGADPTMNVSTEDGVPVTPRAK